MSKTRSARRSPRAQRFFDGLPPFQGGKRWMCALLFAELAGVVPPEAWPQSRFLDPFCGGGAVALYAKAHGFEVVASDAAERGAVVARALIANSRVRLARRDIIDLMRTPLSPAPHVAARFVPAVFTAPQAAWLDRAVAQARRRAEPARSLALLVVIRTALSAQPMSALNGTDAPAAAQQNFDQISPRRVAHYVRAGRRFTLEGAWRTAERVNRGVIGGRGSAARLDALTAITSTPADVLYLDPPYGGTQGYETPYGPLDALLDPSTARPPPVDLNGLLDAARNVPVVALSYGGPTTDLDALRALVNRHRVVRRALAIPHRHFGSLATETKNATNNELLIIATR